MNRKFNFRVFHFPLKEMHNDINLARVGDFNYHVCHLMQSTNLVDKNGVEIFEGDIIVHEREDRPYSKKKRIRSVTCKVVWKDGRSWGKDKELNPILNTNPSYFQEEPHFSAIPLNPDLKESAWGYAWSVFHNCEVVGNIWENPEMLEVKQSMSLKQETPSKEIKLSIDHIL